VDLEIADNTCVNFLRDGHNAVTVRTAQFSSSPHFAFTPQALTKSVAATTSSLRLSSWISKTKQNQSPRSNAMRGSGCRAGKE
jgi:hypothetical protein